MNNRVDTYPVRIGFELFYTDHRFCQLIGCASNPIRLSKVIRKLMEFEYAYIEYHAFLSYTLRPFNSFFLFLHFHFTLFLTCDFIDRLQKNALMNVVNLIFVSFHSSLQM